MHTQFQSQNLKGNDYLGDQVIDGKIIIKWVLNSVWRCGLNSSAQDRIKVQDLANMVINLQVPYNVWNLLASFSRKSLLHEGLLS
jgi:hypothetical protein